MSGKILKTVSGKKHGFEVSDFYWGDKVVDEAMIGKIRETVNV